MVKHLFVVFTGITEFESHPVSLVVSEGSVARFSCAVTSSPPATITWEFNQSTLPLQTDRFMQNTDLLFAATWSSIFSSLTLILLSRLPRLTVLLNGVLQIHNVRLEDAGKYRCVATNIGSRLKSREATLTVHKGKVIALTELPD